MILSLCLSFGTEGSHVGQNLHLWGRKDRSRDGGIHSYLFLYFDDDVLCCIGMEHGNVKRSILI